MAKSKVIAADRKLLKGIEGDLFMTAHIVMPGYPSLPSFSIPRSAYIDFLMQENNFTFEQAVKASLWVQRA